MPNTLPPLTVEFESGVALPVNKITCVKKVQGGDFVMVWAEGTNPKLLAEAFVLHHTEAERFWNWWCANRAFRPPSPPAPQSESEERDK